MFDNINCVGYLKNFLLLCWCDIKKLCLSSLWLYPILIDMGVRGNNIFKADFFSDSSQRRLAQRASKENCMCSDFGFQNLVYYIDIAGK